MNLLSVDHLDMRAICHTCLTTQMFVCSIQECVLRRVSVDVLSLTYQHWSCNIEYRTHHYSCVMTSCWSDAIYEQNTHEHTHVHLHSRTYTRTHTYVHLHSRTYTSTYVHLHSRTYTRTWTRTYMCTYIHAHTHAHEHTNVYLHSRAYTRTYVHLHSRTYTRTWTHTYVAIPTLTHICTPTFTHLHTHINTHIHAHWYTHICTPTLKHIDTHMYTGYLHSRTCTNVNTHTHTHTHNLPPSRFILHASYLLCILATIALKLSPLNLIMMLAADNPTLISITKSANICNRDHHLL